MSTYANETISREVKPKLGAMIDDFKTRKNKDYFWPTGTQVYCGRQGSGKTASAVHHVLKLKERYPKCIVVSNLILNVEWEYIHFQSMDELQKLLVKTNNGIYGVIFLIDEIHTYFNALDSKNIPMYVFTEISQQRKQRKAIIGTSQLFLRMAKPFREQCDNLIICNTTFGFITSTVAYDGMSLDQDYQGNLTGDVKKRGWFFHTRKLRKSYDTYQKVVSGMEQYQNLQPSLKIDVKT